MNETTLKTYQMSFAGSLLKRGFWLYVWKIKSRDRLVLYVGRTGDSSSSNAASPFNRIGQHLDFRQNARGNAMARQLKRAGIDPRDCDFEMLALGPVFEEQKTMALHKPYRDRMSALEKATATFLKNQKYNVLGVHHSSVVVDPEIWVQVENVLKVHFPRCPGAREIKHLSENKQ